MYSWESEITSLISIKECKAHRARSSPSPVRLLFNRECHVAFLSSKPRLPYSSLLFPFKKALSSVSISLSILSPHVARDEPATQHILGESAGPLNSLHSFRLTHASALDGIAARMFDRKIARAAEADHCRAVIQAQRNSQSVPLIRMQIRRFGNFTPRSSAIYYSASHHFP